MIPEPYTVTDLAIGTVTLLAAKYVIARFYGIGLSDVVDWISEPVIEPATDGGTSADSSDEPEPETWQERGRALAERQQDDELAVALGEARRAIWSAESEIPPDADDEIGELLADAERSVAIAEKIRERDVAVEHILDP